MSAVNAAAIIVETTLTSAPAAVVGSVIATALAANRSTGDDPSCAATSTSSVNLRSGIRRCRTRDLLRAGSGADSAVSGESPADPAGSSMSSSGLRRFPFGHLRRRGTW